MLYHIEIEIFYGLIITSITNILDYIVDHFILYTRYFAIFSDYFLLVCKT